MSTFDTQSVKVLWRYNNSNINGCQLLLSGRFKSEETDFVEIHISIFLFSSFHSFRIYICFLAKTIFISFDDVKSKKTFFQKQSSYILL